jgi:hypothetical protein
MVYRSIIVGPKPYFWVQTNTTLPILRGQRPDRSGFPPQGLRLRVKKGERAMIKKKILNPDRIRRIQGGFSFIPHRFLTGGFLASLTPHELLLYFFLVLAGDRNGISFYSYDKICTLLQTSLDRYITARDDLIDKDLIAFDGTIFQVLELPDKPIVESKTEPEPAAKSEQQQDMISAGKIIRQIFKGA